MQSTEYTYVFTIRLTDGQEKIETHKSKENQPRRAIAANMDRFNKRYNWMVDNVQAQKVEL